MFTPPPALSPPDKCSGAQWICLGIHHATGAAGCGGGGCSQGAMQCAPSTAAQAQGTGDRGWHPLAPHTRRCHWSESPRADKRGGCRPSSWAAGSVAHRSGPRPSTYGSSPVQAHGRSWSLMVAHGRSWSLMVAHGGDPHQRCPENPWSLMVAHGRSWSLMVARGGHRCLAPTNAGAWRGVVGWDWVSVRAGLGAGEGTGESEVPSLCQDGNPDG
jgi:hypothetical protein